MPAAMAAALRQKRKRVLSAAMPACHNDTVVVTPATTRTGTELREQPARRVKRRIEVAASQEPTELEPCTDDPSPQPASDECSKTIPPRCCYHCLTRGGNAAYQCTTADGDMRCTRCVRDKRPKCRLPTADEAASIAARCLQCTRRGFKKCDGGNPCDTCIRNKTPEICQSATRRAIKKQADSSEPLAATGSVNDTDTPDSRTTTRRPKQKSVATSQNTENEEGSPSNSSTRPKRTRRSDRRGVVTEESKVHCNVSLPPASEGKLSESHLQEIMRMEEDADCSAVHASTTPLTTSEVTVKVAQSPPLEIPTRSLEATQLNLSHRPAARHTPGKLRSAAQDVFRLPSPVAFDVPTTESPTVTKITLANVETDMTEPGDGCDVDMSQSTIRPRRSRARVSYAEVVEHLELDDGHLIEDSSDTDAYTAFTTDEDTEEDEEMTDTSLDDEHGHQISVDGDEHTTEEVLTEGDEPMEELMEIPKRNKTKSSSQQKAGKGIDFSLPPLDNVKDCFSNLSITGVSLGLGEALKSLGSTQIRIGTMCSGTESPLLALSEISKALEKEGHSSIHFQHEFSAEIEPVKQGFIERNFQPKILFRDVRDFIRESTTTATTAYGAEVDIPTDIHILVAGFVCKDLSRMNNKRKTLEDGGESGDTWLAIYTYAKRFRPSVVLLENVKATTETWYDVVRRWDKIGYEAEWLYCDTKNYYLPQTRIRMYMIAVERSQAGPNVIKIASRWRETMEKLQRQCSSPYEAFIADSLQEPSTYSTPLSESNWALCKLRYDHIRSEQKLGISSPVTRSGGSGIVRPPDFASRQYYESQSSRVWDAIDVAHLQGAKNGSDSLYKMAIWDVSQNVDRFKADLGILPCITPGGSDFASNRQQALLGSQLLLLQGMPMDRLLFANETQKEQQDLAGNAMSTTVIGASLIAAITSCWSSFLLGDQPTPVSSAVNSAGKATANWLEDTRSFNRSSLKSHAYQQVDLTATIIADATRSARFCHCEGTKSFSGSQIRVCSACGHTACVACAGNPKHMYKEVMPASDRLFTPEMFIRKWRPILPPRVRFKSFPDISKLSASQAKHDLITTYLETVREARLDSEYFCIGDFARRAHHWTITYSSPSATLELAVGRSIKWLLYLKCLPTVPGNSPLREFLKFPIARGIVTESLLQPDWEVHLPSGSKHQLHLRGSHESSPSWRSRLGLPEFQKETVPSVLTVRSKDSDLKAVDGDFKHLPHCGTASSSLYKRSTEPALYMFLDPNLLGAAEADSIVFSQDCSRKHYGESRIIVASLEPSWRPWNMDKDHTCSVTVTLPGAWISVAMQLSPVCATADVRHLVKSPTAAGDCSKVLMCLEVCVQEEIPTHPFHAYSWALEQPKVRPSFQEWQEIDTNLTQDCVCAPPYPQLHWSVDKEGIAMAQEDPKSAAVFERAVKSRPSAIQLNVVSGSNFTQIQVGLNVSSLLHRARSSLGCLESGSTSWRLLTDHADLPAQPFSRFYLQSNCMDPHPVPCTVPNYLRGAQAKSLKWMIEQELGRQIVITEVEEAVHAGLNWRLEARAQATQTARGGVLADHPSFGKTVTTIALIQHEFDKHAPDVIVRHNRSAATDGLSGLLDTAATLIVCPPHISVQWKTELERFLGTKEYTLYNVLLIDSLEKLRSLSIEEVMQSRVIIVSWTVLADDEYISELGRFAAMPEPALTSRRAFDVWLARASEAVPDRLAAFRKQHPSEFEKSTAELLQKRLQQPEFQATLPLKIRHGSAYKSFISRQAASKPTKSTPKAKSTTAGKAAFTSWKSAIPLLHLFQFNRIVIDEYHYMNDEKNMRNNFTATSVKKIAAHKRWVLSGTPAMACFSDIDQIASFLGLRLGRTFLGDGTTQSEKAVKADQTPVEDFLSRTEIKSRQWHQARHDRAQEFLDLFVRQNEAQLGHILCSEALLPVELDAAHHAVYLELSQHLIAQRMQLKKLSKKLNSDKTERLNESLSSCSSAEVALIKSALLFETRDGQSGLQSLITKRTRQHDDAKVDLMNLLGSFESLRRTVNKNLRRRKMTNPQSSAADSDEAVATLYGHFRADIMESNWLGDGDASKSVTELLLRAEKEPCSQEFLDLKGLTGERRQTQLKQKLSLVRQLSRECASMKRSERFLNNIKDALERSTSERIHDFKCSAPDCTGSKAFTQMHIITQCGHTACQSCLENRVDDEVCVHPNCVNSPLHNIDLIPMSKLGSSEINSDNLPFGKKLQEIVELVLGLPCEEQGIIFVPDENIVDVLEDVLDYFGISYHSPTRCKAAMSAKIIEDFKNQKDPEERRKILILNLGSESAAGVNLTNANHIIFVSPPSVKSQYEYDSARVQAIARSRRYGQEKKVHIYHVVAERTIDVDILERRHRRNNGITTQTLPMKLPNSSGAAKERTKLVRNKKGEMALVPRSWLKHAASRKTLNISDAPESFASLIRYEGALEHDDDGGNEES